MATSRIGIDMSNELSTFPTDKDIYTLQDTVLRQTECQYTFGKDAATFTIRFAGVTGDVVNLAGQFRQGIRVKLTDLMSKFAELSGLDSSKFTESGKVLTAQSNTKKGHGQATITVSIPYSSKIDLDGGGGGGYEPEETKTVSWSEKTTKYEFDLKVYAGDVSAANEYANAGDYSAWLNEEQNNPDYYKMFTYDDKVSSAVLLSGHTLALAKKHYGGIEAVERGYPEVQRTTAYGYIKGNRMSSMGELVSEIDEKPNLYKIDDTPISVWNSKFPNFSWLKTGYDVDIQPTEYEKYWNATVIESWQGIDIAERGEWDKNLYGQLSSGDRWPFYTKELSADE